MQVYMSVLLIWQNYIFMTQHSFLRSGGANLVKAISKDAAAWLAPALLLVGWQSHCIGLWLSLASGSTEAQGGGRS